MSWKFADCLEMPELDIPEDKVITYSWVHNLCSHLISSRFVQTKDISFTYDIVKTRKITEDKSL